MIPASAAQSSKINKNRLKGLYAITDETLIDEQNFTKLVELALLGGARIIQYRDKTKNQQKRFQQASALRLLCQQYKATLIINDDIKLAREVQADGVHLGKNDDSIIRARAALGDNAIIGISCYNDLSLAIEAEKNSADYVAFGAMFASSTKPEAIVAGTELLATARRSISIPVCAIGGITENNVQQVIAAGADMTAVISHLFSASDIKKTAEMLSQYFCPISSGN